MKAAAVAALKADHPLPVLLEVAQLARSTFYYHQAKPQVCDPWADLKTAIVEAFEAAGGRYGHRRIHAVVSGRGFVVAKKTVLALMRELALICRVRRRRRYNSYTGAAGQIAENLLNRDFSASAPNQKWVTDVTEFRIADRKVYLSPVLDLFDRSVVAYAWSMSPNVELTNTSLTAAIATLQPGECPLVHSDQGFQYRHWSWRKLLGDAEALQSMSRKGNCYDNAVMENFFGHLKSEMFHHNRFDTVEDFATALDTYIHWYNTERISTKLKGLSPVQYRAQALAA
ncbi:integrase [Mycolicibacterium wolinskyi]|uniref:Integrase n=1 Tax=Mycolicibacterium wolinskyi TaxID=59750 RepID=A0A132PAR2_9MYCO|nr:IS3 family transposase [Mycolicibacterium wolinskyi]KWX19420.1 integrase [Mycolicibacterium wolinskyi]